MVLADWILQELRSAGGKTVWGDPADVGKIVGAESFDVVLDNNGKDLDAVKYVSPWPFILLLIKN